jgi:hypothetical protein
VVTGEQVGMGPGDPGAAGCCEPVAPGPGRRVSLPLI